MLVSLFGVGVSFWITQQVNNRLSEINLRSVPMQRELTQLSSDTELLKRELDRSLGFAHWSDPRWKPRRIPLWAIEVHRTTLERIRVEDLNTAPWKQWYERLQKLNSSLATGAESLFVELQAGHTDKASELYPVWLKQIDMIQKEVEWARREIDSETRFAYREAQGHVQHLRMALQVLLLVVISVALLVLWMGERALRPIGLLRRVVRQINDRGSLTSKERAELPVTSLHQKDEVSELAREFHQMATTLIERERMIEHQKARLEEQNKTLMEMGELQKRLQQAEHLAAVGRLSAQVAHEVGNPLHSIGLESELALDVLGTLKTGNSAGVIAMKQSLSSIVGSVERLQKIIQNYLKLSRLTPDVNEVVDLKIVLESALATYANSIQQMKVQVSWQFDPMLENKAMVMGDPEMIEYAFGNLIRNSLQALDREDLQERRIFIALKKRESKKIHIDFQDSGPGVPDSVRAELFKPFFTTKAQGTGLGLSFVKKVFSDLGGDFQLSSSTQLKGAHFEGYLPIVEVQPPVFRGANA
jgi:signal transduction histidine kinase